MVRAVVGFSLHFVWFGRHSLTKQRFDGSLPEVPFPGPGSGSCCWTGIEMCGHEAQHHAG